MSDQSRPEPMTSIEIANELGVNDKTVTGWISRYDVPGASKKGRRWRIGPDALEALKTIARLRQGHSGDETIRRAIGSRPEPIPDSPKSEATRPEPKAIPPISDIIRSEIREALSESTDLAEKYARATYTIGQLEERVRAQEEKILHLEASTKPWWQIWK